MWFSKTRNVSIKHKLYIKVKKTREKKQVDFWWIIFTDYRNAQVINVDAIPADTPTLSQR